MTDDSEDFAAFEAKVSAAEPTEAPKEVEAEAVTEPVEEAADDVADETTEEPKAEDDEPKKRRSKPASERIAELTARLRETERERDALKSPSETKPLEKPDPADFEFGEADPDYLDKLTDYKLETRDAEKAKQTEAQQAEQQKRDELQAGIAKAEEAGKAKYDDFDAKITEAVEARGGVPLPQLLSTGISLSPVGGDITYRLATDEAISERLETLAQTNIQACALAFGELEGEYLTDDTDADLDMTDQLDMARMLGRMRARLKGSKPVEKPAIKLTNAPEPPKERARGGSGQFGTAPDTTDFAAFEKLATAR